MLLLLLGVSSWRKARIIEIVYRRRFERHGVDESIAAAVSAKRQVGMLWMDARAL